MSTRKLQLSVSGFTDGLNTEASVLNVLPSEMMDGTINVELTQSGTAYRRAGVDFIGNSSAGGHLQVLRIGSSALETRQESPSVVYVKLTAPNGAIVERIIADINNQFRIYQVTNDGLRNIDVPYQTINRSFASADDQKYYNMQFAQSGNRVFFAGRFCQPGYLQVLSDNISLESVHYDVLIRDLSQTRLSTRVSRNGAYFECIEAHTSDSTNSPGDGTGTGVFVWQRYWRTLNGAPTTVPGAWSSGQAYTSNFIKKYSKLDTVTSLTPRPTAVEFFAGRVWLAGDPNAPNTIYFCQTIESDINIEEFYQYADPNDTGDPNLVDSDGGVIQLQGSGVIYKLVAVSSALVVCTSLGAWQISGQLGIFKATSFMTINVLADGILGPENVTKVDQNLVIFAKSSIWLSQIEKSTAVTTSGQITFVSMSMKRIQTMYNNIPSLSKASGHALYNSANRKVYYFYNDSVTDWDYSYNSTGQPGYARNVLVFDTFFDDQTLELPQPGATKRTIHGAFSKWSYADGALSQAPYIAFPFIAPNIVSPASNNVSSQSSGLVIDAATDQVVSQGANVTVDNVYIMALQRSDSAGSTTIRHAFGTLEGATLTDWGSDVTYMTSYTSRIICGLQTGGDTLHNKSPLYVYFVFQKVESGILDGNGVDVTPGGCFLRTATNFAFTTTAKKYHAQVQIYKPYRFSYSLNDGTNDGYNYTWFKHRVRGRGHVFQFIMESDGDKDFHLVGWSQQHHDKAD